MNKNNENKNNDAERNHTEVNQHELLCALIFDEITPEERTRIEADLDASEELREEKARLEATVGLIRDTYAGEEALPGELMARLESAAGTPSENGTLHRPRFGGSLLRVAAGLLVLVGAVVAMRAYLGQGKNPEVNDKAMLATVDSGEKAHGEEQVAMNDGYARDVREAPTSELGVNESSRTLELAKSEFEMEVHETERRLRAAADREGAPGQLQSEAPGQQVGLPVLTAATASEEPDAEVAGETVSVGRSGGPYGTSAGAAPAPGAANRPDASTQTLVGQAGSESSGANPPAEAKPFEEKLARAKFALKGTGKQVAPATRGAETKSKGSGTYHGGGDVVPTGGAGGAGPSTPGPSGPATPGPTNETPRAGLLYDGPEDSEAARDGLGREGREYGDDLLALNFEELEGTQADGGLTSGDDFWAGAGQRKSDLGRRRWTEAEITDYSKRRAERILHHCRPRPDEKPSMMFFRFWGDNPFELTQLDNQSTFGVDVDTASYALARRYLREGILPGKAQIRTEEFINYFKPDLAPPAEGVFAIHTELAASRFSQSDLGRWDDKRQNRYMLRVGIRGREVSNEERKPVALTFVVDTSGSMEQGGRLELVKHSLRLLVAQLDARDSIGLVAFSNEAQLILPNTSAADRGVIEAAVYGLHPGGGTNAEAGLMLGYELSVNSLDPEAVNRVVLLSDGVANIGQTDQERLNEAVRSRRDKGIYLNTIGVGMGNHNDVFLEQLANKGDGLCNYVDSAEEAKRALVDNFTGAFEPIARDVKIQVEFDPSQVYRYRLLGYENRAIADADFRNDKVDAGEVGAGHQVTALYELELTGEAAEKPMAVVNLRYKQPIGPGRDPLEDGATEIHQTVSASSATSYEEASLGYKRSVCVAQFAEILRRSIHARGESLDDLIRESARIAPPLADPDFNEFVAMLQRSHELIRNSRLADRPLRDCIDVIRRNRYLQAQYQELSRERNDELVAELEHQNAELEQRIRELIEGQVREHLK